MKKIYFIPFGEEGVQAAEKIAADLETQNASCFIAPLRTKGLKGHLGIADKNGFSHVIIVDEAYYLYEKVYLINMLGKIGQREVKIENLMEVLKNDEV